MRASLHRGRLRYGGGLVLHTASSGSVPHLDELYLRLDDGEAVGVGEVRINIAYLNGYEPETVVSAALTALGAADWSRGASDLLAGLDAGEDRPIPPVRCLLDIALHDLVARRAGRPLAEMLSGSAISEVAWPTNQTLFWSHFAEFLAKAEGYVARGFRSLKVRVAAGPIGEDVRRLAALRDRFGQEVTLAADANGQWASEDALRHLEALAPYGLAYVEQPIPPGDWDAVGRLAEASPVPIMLDEGLGSAHDVEALCAFGGRLYGHLKLVKLGGIAPTLAAARRLASAGVPFMIGQMNEGGTATAAALHAACATRPAFAELYGADGLVDDPCPGLAYAEGRLRVAAGPGLGVSFDAARTEQLGEWGA